MKLHLRAPGKVNLCLFLGPVRDDGRHELVTVLESVSLTDELRAEIKPSPPDTVQCDEVGEPNLVEVALQRLRESGWDGPSLHIEVVKRIPVAGGMGGGSADAAAVLRLAQQIRPVSPAILAQLAAELGADVPSQLAPGLVLGTAAGERVRSLAPLAPHALVIVPQPHRLSTREVYAQADRLGLGHDHARLEAKRTQLEAALTPGGRLPDSLLVNELAPAALSLAPQIAEALEAARQAGADHALVSGSGPTVFGLFWGREGSGRAAQAEGELRARFPAATAARPVDADFARPREHPSFPPSAPSGTITAP